MLTAVPTVPAWSSSLPLMGIENPGQATREASSSPISLPLMGIENIESSDSLAACSASHYPSWGSKTTVLGAVHVDYQLDSLPLMGIENMYRRGIPRGCTRSISLPLMGIENERIRLRQVRQPGLLITPHGDRKPAAARPCRHSQYRLITPHGDRKPRTASGSRCTGTIGLITPHGDRKRPHEGILHVQAADLITPHGDRKRRYAPLPAPQSSTTHYPSWGSKTRCTPSTRLRGISLPLMGIENRDARGGLRSRRPAHYPSWGSKTGGALNGLPMAEWISLPLMGIENSPPRWLLSQTITSSLPLMGIENPISR